MTTAMRCLQLERERQARESDIATCECGRQVRLHPGKGWIHSGPCTITEDTARELGVTLKEFTWIRDPAWPTHEIYITEEHGSLVAVTVTPKHFNVVWQGFAEHYSTLEEAFKWANRDLSYLEHSQGNRP